MQEYAQVHCPGCGERVDVPMHVVLTVATPFGVEAQSKGQTDHVCADKVVAVDGR